MINKQKYETSSIWIINDVPHTFTNDHGNRVMNIGCQKFEKFLTNLKQTSTFSVTTNKFWELKVPWTNNSHNCFISEWSRTKAKTCCILFTRCRFDLAILSIKCKLFVTSLHPEIKNKNAPTPHEVMLPTNKKIYPVITYSNAMAQQYPVKLFTSKGNLWAKIKWNGKYSTKQQKLW